MDTHLNDHLDDYERERASEQAHVDLAYARLDELRTRSAAALNDVRRSSTAGTPAALAERDAFDQLYTERVATLEAVEDRLCFGRLDVVPEDGAVLEERHIGRIGLNDDAGDQLLVDWRAPAAEPFYRATAAHPQGVVRRRHLATKDRVVESVEDDVLDLDAVDDATVASSSGEGSLMMALGANRTGRMRDIVATIQSEQDEVVRAPLAGVLVVQGGPGTGKTAVALHRAAYLLYTHRERIAKSGVLLVGPSHVFLRYVEQVLPALGETGVLMRTVGELFPGVDAVAQEDPRVTAVKGDARMAALLTSAVQSRQRVPDGPRRLDVDGTVITLRPRDVMEARDRARGNRKPHNLARVDFVKDVLNRLASRLAHQRGTELDSDNRGELLSDLRGARDVRREVNLCWMPLTPQQFLIDLYADPSRRAGRGHTMSTVELELLHRDRPAPGEATAWSAADVPLLDELAELLGEDDSAERLAAARQRAERQTEVDYARGVLQMSGSGGMMTADDLVDRYAGSASLGPLAERAAADRTWTFGHVVIDEAQELSAMAWRLLMRRCPTKSMTIVGDVDQTSTAAGASSWAQMLDPFVAGRWRMERLTVNYRTPREVMDLAARVLAASGAETHVPTSVRAAAWPPRRVALGTGSVDGAAGVVGIESVVTAVREELDVLGAGTIAVVTSRSSEAAVRAAVQEGLSAAGFEVDVTDEDAQVRVLDVAAVKGLEFDGVVLVEPADVVAESPRGINDLYVALTRPTQRLAVLHARPLPDGFEDLQ